MRKENWYLSTIDAQASQFARELGLGVEIAEFCTAGNMDADFPAVSAKVDAELEGISRRLLHGPFNELFPCAIDPKARTLAAQRYHQALELGNRYGAEKVILHAGFQPFQYFPCWFTEKSVVFWQEFLQNCPGDTTIVLENVLEKEPQWLLDIVSAVDDPRLRLCLDIGHANVYSQVPIETWIDTLAPYLSHFHIHNNSGAVDSHDPLHRGSIPMERILEQAEKSCPQATFTAEVINGQENMEFLGSLF